MITAQGEIAQSRRTRPTGSRRQLRIVRGCAREGVEKRLVFPGQFHKARGMIAPESHLTPPAHNSSPDAGIGQKPAPPVLPWLFPAETTHYGLPLGNGTFGALLWGGGDLLHITINRQDYWDHRGGLTFGAEATYENLRNYLENWNEEKLRGVFEGRGHQKPGEPRRPTRLPMGMVTLQLPSGEHLVAGELQMGRGVANVQTTASAAEAILLRREPVLVLRWTGQQGLKPGSHPSDAPEVREYYRTKGFEDPVVFDEEQTGGWTHRPPADPALCVRWRMVQGAGGTELYITALYGDTAEAARAAAEEMLQKSMGRGWSSLAEEEQRWWSEYWNNCAAVEIPDQQVAEIYWLGMYKLPGLSSPGSPAATLQGAWVEEYRMPPWSCDYHFNINVQECYWPAYGGNYLDSLEPLVRMVQSWLPKMRENARGLFGIEDGLMLPHAVDDRCNTMGGFWAGSVDHGSTAWTAQLFWLRYLYTGDEQFLEEVVYPLLRGAMRCYEAMLEKQDGQWRLPVSVSPEFGGNSRGAWGVNATFQLSIVHFLCRTLKRCCRILRKEDEGLAMWEELDRDLALASTVSSQGGEEIALWENQPLSESHRHHSHLAGIYPFDVLDYDAGGADRDLVRRSLHTWTRKGPGQWSGWCVPWASIIWARMGEGAAAALHLELYRRVFTLRGGSSTHDAAIPGLSALGGYADVMQIEATMGATAAVMEMLLHTKKDVLHVFPAVPGEWRDLAFHGIRAEGAFLVSARRRKGATEQVLISSLAGSPLRMKNPFGGKATLTRNGAAAEELQGDMWEVATSKGEQLRFMATES